MSGDHLGLVLSGGGAPAAYFGTGVVQAIEEAGLHPTVVSGVSAGAINACALGIGLTGDGLAAIWQDIRWYDIYRPRIDVWNIIKFAHLFRFTANPIEYMLGAVGWGWLLDSAPARRALSRRFGGEQLTPTEGTTVVVSAVDSNDGDVVRFCTELPPPERRGPEFRLVDLSIDHLLASFAVPLLFPPGHSEGHDLNDAGLVANTPLAPVMRYEPDAVIIVSGAGIRRPAPRSKSYGEALNLLVDNVAHFALMADYEHAKTVNTLAREAPGATTRREVPMLLIEPTGLPFSVGGFLQFTGAQAKEVIEYGRAQGRKALDGWSP
jgi:NTE family protein